MALHHIFTYFAGGGGLIQILLLATKTAKHVNKIMHNRVGLLYLSIYARVIRNIAEFAASH